MPQTIGDTEQGWDFLGNTCYQEIREGRKYLGAICSKNVQVEGMHENGSCPGDSLRFLCFDAFPCKVMPQGDSKSFWKDTGICPCVNERVGHRREPAMGICDANRKIGRRMSNNITFRISERDERISVLRHSSENVSYIFLRHDDQQWLCITQCFPCASHDRRNFTAGCNLSHNFVRRKDSNSIRRGRHFDFNWFHVLFSSCSSSRFHF